MFFSFSLFRFFSSRVIYIGFFFFYVYKYRLSISQSIGVVFSLAFFFREVSFVGVVWDCILHGLTWHIYPGLGRYGVAFLLFVIFSL